MSDGANGLRQKPRRRRRRPNKAPSLNLSCLSPNASAADHSRATSQAAIAAPPPAKLRRLSIGGAAAPGGSISIRESETTGTATTALSSGAAAGQPAAENSALVAAAAGKRGGRRRRRRAPRRKWKPYFKLTNDERRLQEIREEKRAERVRAQRFKKGLPVAPYNTTQFLFNDLKERGGNDEPSNVDEIVENIRHHHRSESNENGDESGSDQSGAAGSSGGDVNHLGAAPNSFDLFNDKEFENEYDSAFVERLSSMSKNELIKDYLDLEKQFERTRAELIDRDRENAQLKERLTRLESLAPRQRSTAFAAATESRDHLFNSISDPNANPSSSSSPSPTSSFSGGHSTVT